MSDHTKISTLLKRFKNHDRNALSKIITIIESSNERIRKDADRILSELSPPTSKTIRIAISGPPGVGKSTFINALGRKLLTKGMKIAILPIDPSSEISSGSILADKTRMKDLLSSSDVYIRPSPSKGALGGVTLFTKDVIYAVESFGFNVVIIETVGVGQSETHARCLSDHFVVLMQPGSGDQLQAMKKGILEIADFILVNKADDEQASLAKKAKNELVLLKNKQENAEPIIASVSGLKDIGIDDFLEKLFSRHKYLEQSGELEKNREALLERLFYVSFHQVLMSRIINIPHVKHRCEHIIQTMIKNNLPFLPTLARLADEICQIDIDKSAAND